MPVLKRGRLGARRAHELL